MMIIIIMIMIIIMTMTMMIICPSSSLHLLRKQWTTGAVTSTLLGLQTLSTITQSGIWEFMDESRHKLGPELMTQVRYNHALCLGFEPCSLDMLSGEKLF